MLSRVLSSRRVLPGGLIVILILAGCDTSHDLARSENTLAATASAPATASSPSKGTSGPAPTAAGLRAALLTARDLPPGYTAQHLSQAGLGGSSIAGCPALDSNPSGISASATVGLTDAATGSTVIESLLQMSSTADAVGGMADFAAMPSSCRSFSGNVDGLTITFGTAPLALPAVGDQTTAARMTGEISGGVRIIDVDVVAVRHGRTLMEILCLGLTADGAFTRHVITLAYSALTARR